LVAGAPAGRLLAAVLHLEVIGGGGRAERR